MKDRMNIIKTIKFEKNYFGQGLFVLIGLIMVAATLAKLLGYFNINSDWFWFIAGLGLTVEGGISLVKQKKFNSKYKILSREEFEKLTGEKA